MASIKEFLTMVLKNGGAQFVLVLVLAWVFSQYFPINPELIATLLEWLLIAALIEGIYRLVINDLFFALYKYGQYKVDCKQEDYSEVENLDTNVKAAGLELGIDGLQYLKDTLVKDPTTKAQELIAKIEAQLHELNGI